MQNSQVKKESPLIEFFGDDIVSIAPLISIVEEPFLTQYVLRVKSDNTSFIEQLNAITGMELPLTVNQSLFNHDSAVCCLSPDEWLFIDRRENAAEILQSVDEACKNNFALVSEITGGQTILHLKGTHVRKVLAKGMMFDTHPSVFAFGNCAQTVFAGAPVLMIPVKNKPGNDEQHFILVIRRSFSDHLARWLQDACLEYSV